MEHLAELEGVFLALQLQGTADEDEDTASGAGRLAINGGDMVLTLLEREASELGSDGLGAGQFLTFEGKHGTILVEGGKACTIVVKDGVIVIHEGFGKVVGIHRHGCCSRALHTARKPCCSITCKRLH